MQSHRDLSDEADGGVIALLKGFAVRGGTELPLSQRYIAFIEYAEGGDVDKLIDAIAPIDQNNPTRAERNGPFLPEVFIWILLERLAKACLKVEELRVVHPDIKVRASSLFLSSFFLPIHPTHY